MNNAININPKGFLTITIRDAETLAVKSSVEETNEITIAGMWRSFLGNDNFDDADAPGFERIFVSETQYPQGIRTFWDYGAIDTTTATEDTEVQAWEAVKTGSPVYVEKVGRFNSPTSTKTIRAIGLTDGSGIDAGTMAVLTTPCIQNPGEVLDITYRIQVFAQAASTGDLPVAKQYAEAIVDHLAFPGSGNGSFPAAVSWMFSAVPPIDSIDYGMPIPTTAKSAANNLAILDHFKKEFKTSPSTSTDIGLIIRSLGLGGVFVGSDWEDDNKSRTIAWAPLLQDDSPYKPVQTIHNHSANAVEWGLDVDFLATGQGEITIDGSSWEQSNFPEFWRIDYTKTGNVGVSNYAFRTRKTLGFNGNTYGSARTLTKMFSKLEGRSNLNRKTVSNGHGLLEAFKVEEYDVETIITWDATGITLTNVNKTDSSVTFDAATSPSLPVTSINQVATDTNGNIWVACANTGLYKISDPTGTPTISLMSGGNGLPGSSNAYGVAVGFNDSLWAVVDGGLITTSDTSGTVTFTTSPFTYTGVSDSNWHTIRYMRVDRASPDNQMALIKQETPGLEDHVVWYSTTTLAVAGHTTDNGPIDWGMCYVGRKGHYWMHVRVESNITGSSATRLFFGESVRGVTDGTGMGRGFMYDYYGVPYLFNGPTNNSNLSDGDSMLASNRNARDQMMGIDGVNAGYYGTAFVFESDGGDMLMQNRTIGANVSTTIADHVAQPIPLATHGLDALNGQHSPMEEFIWSKYHWNGTSWEQDYYAPAIDTATITGGPYNAIRHNFDTESHSFTGRSMIDTSPAFVTGNFSTNATIALKYNTIAKKRTDTDHPEQERHQCLFSVFANDQLVSIYIESGDGNTIFLSETIGGGNRNFTSLGSTLTQGIDRRAVITFDGTSVALYIDGAQVGSTATLTQAIDWSNVSSDLAAYVGCAVYPDVWNVNEIKQRITPQPSSFFRGTVENVQLWNTTWTTTDITNDNANPDGVISSQPSATAMVARYELTQSLEGLETKPTHAAPELLKDTVNISFADGASGDAFVATDYHTFGMVDGVLKDNAIAFDHTFSMYFTPTDFDFNDFKNGANGDTVSATTTQITEIAKFVNQEAASSYVSTSNTAGNVNTIPHTIKIPGEVSFNSTSGSTPHTSASNNPHGVMSGAPFTGDGWFEFRLGYDVVNDTIVGLSDQNWDNIHILPDRFTHGYKFKTDSTIDVMEGTTNTATILNIGSYTVEDVFRIIRTGNTITLEKTDSLGATTVLHTSSKASTGTVYPRISIYRHTAIVDCKINHTLPPHVMLIGDISTSSGIFDDDFLIVDTHSPETIEIFLDGSPAVVNISNTHFDGMTVPAIGEVTINGILGWLVFNPADVGKTITGKVVTIYEKV